MDDDNDNVNSGHWSARGGLGRLFDDVSLYAMIGVCTFQGIYLVCLICCLCQPIS